MIEADALILHLNPLQEVLQPEGDTDFSDLASKIGEIKTSLNVPVIVKEVGWGISLQTAKLLSDAGIEYIDIAGAGGTSWSQIEKFRSTNDEQTQIAEIFRDWGIPTADSLIELSHSELPISILASGGLRTGLDAAKCLALGAIICGFAGRLIKAATISEEAITVQLNMIMKELQLTMFAAGVRDIDTLKNTPINKKYSKRD